MTMSWNMMMEFDPPQVACVVSSANYSFAALRAARECFIATPSVDLAPIVVRVGKHIRQRQVCHIGPDGHAGEARDGAACQRVLHQSRMHRFAFGQ